MALLEFTVNYPKGFHDPIVAVSSGCRVDVPTNKERERFPDRYTKRTQVVLPSSTTLTLEKLILIFNNIIKTYKLNPDRYLGLNTISAIITNEESVVKNALTILNGKQGRFVYVKNHDPATINCMKMTNYNPILKEIKNHLLILFHRFLIHKEKNTEDIIMFEGHYLFIHLFAIIIDSFRYPDPYVIGNKDCTDTFAMCTLLEVLLKKKYKHTLNFHINSIPLPKVEVEVKVEVNADDVSEDDEWLKDDFELSFLRQTIPAPAAPSPPAPAAPSPPAPAAPSPPAPAAPSPPSTQSTLTPPPAPAPVIIQPSTIIIEPITDTKNNTDLLEIKTEDKTEDIPDDWESI
jgi:hypothetical protein